MIELLLAGVLAMSGGEAAEFDRWDNFVECPNRHINEACWVWVPPPPDEYVVVNNNGDILLKGRTREEFNKKLGEALACRDKMEAAMRAMEKFIPAVIQDGIVFHLNPSHYTEEARNELVGTFLVWQAVEQECWKGER